MGSVERTCARARAREHDSFTSCFRAFSFADLALLSIPRSTVAIETVNDRAFCCSVLEAEILGETDLRRFHWSALATVRAAPRKQNLKLKPYLKSVSDPSSVDLRKNSITSGREILCARVCMGVRMYACVRANMRQSWKPCENRSENIIGQEKQWALTFPIYLLKNPTKDTGEISGFDWKNVRRVSASDRDVREAFDIPSRNARVIRNYIII